MTEIPRIISVDDHVVEPPTLWTDRLPAKYQDRCPRVERDRARFSFEGGVFSYERGVEDGEWCDWWVYDDLVYPFPKLSAAASSASQRGMIDSGRSRPLPSPADHSSSIQSL